MSQKLFHTKINLNFLMQPKRIYLKPVFGETPVPNKFGKFVL